MGLLKYIVSLPSHPRASIIASMLANIPTITCCCDDVLPTEPHIESQLQFLSTIVSACCAYTTLSACVDCISPRPLASLFQHFCHLLRSRRLLRCSLPYAAYIAVAACAACAACVTCLSYASCVAAADAALAPLAPLAPLARPTLLASLLLLVSLAAP